MARTYKVEPMTRFVNRIMQALLRLSIAPANTYLLTVKGRKRQAALDARHVGRRRQRPLARCSLWPGRLGAQCAGGGAGHADARIKIGDSVYHQVGSSGKRAGAQVVHHACAHHPALL
jgi:hypothetical protein